MTYTYFSRDGALLPIDQATIPLSNVAFAYGYGVYENIKVSNGRIYFLDDHCQRLLQSAEIIALPHKLDSAAVSRSIEELLAKNAAETCNVKVLLVGGQTADDAVLYIMCLNPLFPDRKLYRDGATTITYNYEREFPQAKTLNMLSSYLAYREARVAGAYDALLINRQGKITEGTRTNFFALKDRTIFSPPASEILPGVTRHYVLQVARESGYQIIEQNLSLADLNQYDSFFLTSTSSKILPVGKIDSQVLNTPSPILQELTKAFDQYLNTL